MGEKPTPIKIQLAIQGGGAKIYALVAALEVIEKLEADGKVQITRIAGTSAGAIAGAMYAAGIAMKVVKAELGKLTGDELKKRFPRPSKMAAMGKVLWGTPFWETAHLQKLLSDLLKNDAGQLHTLKDIAKVRNIDLLIMAASLTDSGKVVYKQDSAEGSAITAILNSCALPYCFRVWNNSDNPVIVDGGICENLPSEELELYPEDDGAIVAISFAKTGRKSLKNWYEFSIALLDTAITNSQERAKARLGENNVLSIQTDISTFEFERASTVGLTDTYYTNIKYQTKDFFNNFIASKQHAKNTIAGDPWATQNIATMQQVGKIYDAQFKRNKWAYERCALTVLARDLLNEGEDGYGQPSLVHYCATFTAADQPIHCRRINVSKARHDSGLERTSWSVTRRDSAESIISYALPMISHQDGGLPGRELLVFFDPVLPANSGPYTMDFQDLIDGFLSGLKDTGRDDLIFFPGPCAGPIKAIDLVLWLPKSFPAMNWISKDGRGRKMTTGELANYSAPPYFRAEGWCGTDLEPIAFGVDLVVQN
jgi:predicted acylesterase/phospholipase RssA